MENVKCSNPSLDLNYPSFIVFYCDNTTSKVQTFQRTVTNVGSGAMSYKARVETPKGSEVFVLPETSISKQERQAVIQNHYKI
ncbi:Peptidase S8, subtilisin-related [Parasponia andersonii]|uniref:Peptidase S8, subtilisin-related n=1 Tax=Parasponia andersonii TaxID=3476 RepID=A0A2P5D4K5_PARAD|nr:Peptidase S8, subtilisin-related [Parasponia andersonii]